MSGRVYILAMNMHIGTRINRILSLFSPPVVLLAPEWAWEWPIMYLQAKHEKKIFSVLFDIYFLHVGPSCRDEDRDPELPKISRRSDGSQV